MNIFDIPTDFLPGEGFDESKVTSEQRTTQQVYSPASSFRAFSPLLSDTRPLSILEQHRLKFPASPTKPKMISKQKQLKKLQNIAKMAR